MKSLFLLLKLRFHEQIYSSLGSYSVPTWSYSVPYPYDRFYMASDRQQYSILKTVPHF
jgi:hypothetical protein